MVSSRDQNVVEALHESLRTPAVPKIGDRRTDAVHGGS